MCREELKAKVELGIRQIANGEYVEYTRKTLHKLFDEIEEKGMKRQKQGVRALDADMPMSRWNDDGMIERPYRENVPNLRHR